MIGEDPGHGHLDGELDPLAHCHLQVELPVPQLGQVTAVLEIKLCHFIYYSLGIRHKAATSAGMSLYLNKKCYL